MKRVRKTIQSGNWEVPLDQFISQTSDPIYWSVIATVLLKAIFQKMKTEGKLKTKLKVKTERKSVMTEQDEETIQKKIKELGQLSYDFLLKAYNEDQEKTIEFLMEARIGGYSIIGKLLNNAI